MNEKSKIQQIVAFSKSDNFHAMEKSCRQILKNKPGSFDALQFLGLALSKQGKQEEAIVAFKKALSFNNAHAGLLNNLAYVYIERKQYQDALNCLRQSIELEPHRAEFFNNLGISLFGLRKYKESQAAYENAIKLDPLYAQAIDNLGVCLKKMGFLHEAIEQHIKANDLNPISSGVYVNLFQVLSLCHVTDDALYVARKGSEMKNCPASDRLKLLISVAVNSWLSGKLNDAQDAIAQCESILSEVISTSAFAPTIAFQKYISRLLKIRSEEPDLYRGQADKVMFFVGDSHCLSPSETTVTYEKQTFRVLSSLIVGCKAWHLGRNGCNEFKKSLKILFKAIPEKSHIVVGFGEIDCRTNEGILPAYLNTGIDFNTSVPDLVERYVEFVSYTARQFGHKLIFYGVPRPHPMVIQSLDDATALLLINIICLFNSNLKEAASKKGHELADVYSFTTKFQKSRGVSHHIDGFHLHPKVLNILFQSHLVTPSSSI